MGILLAVFIYYKQKDETKGNSNFFLFVSTADKRISFLARRVSTVLFIIIMLIYALVEAIKIIKPSVLDESTLKILMVVSLSAMFSSIIAQTILNQFLVFKNNEHLDKLLDKDKQKLSDYKENLDMFCVIVISIIPIISSIIGKVIVVLAISILLVLSLQAVYCSYLHVYFQLRRRYHVKKICVNTQNKVYDDIFCYSLRKGMIDFSYYNDGIVKQIKIPQNKISSIENTMDISFTLLDYCSAQMKEKKQECY